MEIDLLKDKIDSAYKLISLIRVDSGLSYIIGGGCHVGEFPTAALEIFGESNILSFEPDPESFKTAKKNLEKFNSVEVVQTALGKTQSRAEFFRGPFSATNSLLPRPKDSKKQYFPPDGQLTGG